MEWRSAFSGTFTTGGNEANLSALAMALSTRCSSVIEDGIGCLGAQPVFYASVEARHSLDKCAGLLGLGRKALRRIPVSERLQLDVPHLEAAINQDLSAGCPRIPRRLRWQVSDRLCCRRNSSPHDWLSFRG
jgi:glutamate/tyrosine decarboxylase-like PLP-dependent enzyme